MENGNDYGKRDRNDGYFSKKLRAGKRRTYFFDVKTTRGNDYYITITESKKRFNQGGYDSHKVFLYKEDFVKFVDALNETVSHIREELNPDFDYDNFEREDNYNQPKDGEILSAPASDEMPVEAEANVEAKEAIAEDMGEAEAMHEDEAEMHDTSVDNITDEDHRAPGYEEDAEKW